MEPLDELIRRMETMPCDGSTVAVPLDTWELAHYYLQHMSEADEEMREDLRQLIEAMLILIDGD